MRAFFATCVVLGCLTIVAVMIAWRRAVEQAAARRFAAEVDARRVADAKTVEQQAFQKADERQAATLAQDPLITVNEAIERARGRGGP